MTEPAQVCTPNAIRHARSILTGPEFDVWLTKTIAGKGRRSGSLTLGITEDAWRYRLDQAIRKINAAKERAA